MQVLATGAVELLLSGEEVDLQAGLAGGAVEPEGDVRAGGLDEGAGQRVLDVLLDEVGEVVDLAEEDDPAVVGGVVG